MTLAQQLKQEGLQQGWHEMAKSLLAEGMPLEFIKKNNQIT
ncbi:MAG: transposase [Candidatus Aquirickettsiella sp.]